jgi:hypothetical protein
MAKKLIQERILNIEETLLSEDDRNNLIQKRNKQLRFLLVSYIPLALILAYVFFSGPSVVYHDKFPYAAHEVDDDDAKNFSIAAPYTCGFLFLLLTGFFLRYYLQTAAPLVKDLQKNKKLLLSIKIEKTDMSLFSKYYLTTPIRQKQQIQISGEDFQIILDDSRLVLEITPYSQSVLRLTNNEKPVSFH